MTLLIPGDYMFENLDTFSLYVIQHISIPCDAPQHYFALYSHPQMNYNILIILDFPYLKPLFLLKALYQSNYTICYAVFSHKVSHKCAGSLFIIIFFERACSEYTYVRAVAPKLFPTSYLMFTFCSLIYLYMNQTKASIFLFSS